MTDVIGKTPSARIAAGAMVAVDVEAPVAVGVGGEVPVGVSLGASVPPVMLGVIVAVSIGVLEGVKV